MSLLTRVALFPALLTALHTAAPWASAAAGEAEEPPGIPKWIRLVGDVDKPDKARIDARNALVEGAAAKELLELWKASKN